MTVDAGGLADLKREVAQGCRVMAHQGLVEDILGHISFRVDEAHALVRCRGPQERGLRFTTPDDLAAKITAKTGNNRASGAGF